MAQALLPAVSRLVSAFARWPGTAIAVALGFTLFAQQVQIQPRAPRKGTEPEQEAPTPDIRSDSTLVLIPVAVTDELNRPITGLEAENFQVFEDKVEQKISSFAMEDEPIALCLVFDTSGSMGGTLGQSRAAAVEFFRLANPEDQFCLVEFSDSPRVAVPLTSTPSTIRTELLFTKSRGSTAVVDGVILGLHELKKSKLARKAIVLVSDGGDNHSRYTPRELQNIVRESDALIFSIGILGSDYDPGFLKGLAEETGGRLFVARQVSLPELADKITIELRNRYVLGYTPANSTRDGQYRKVEVKLKPPRGLPKLKAQWRRGYYSRQD